MSTNVEDSSKPFPFFDMSLELRKMVYRHLTRTVKIRVRPDRGPYMELDAFPIANLRLSSRQLKDESDCEVSLSVLTVAEMLLPWKQYTWDAITPPLPVWLLPLIRTVRVVGWHRSRYPYSLHSYTLQKDSLTEVMQDFSHITNDAVTCIPALRKVLIELRLPRGANAVHPPGSNLFSDFVNTEWLVLSPVYEIQRKLLIQSTMFCGFPDDRFYNGLNAQMMCNAMRSRENLILYEADPIRDEDGEPAFLLKTRSAGTFDYDRLVAQVRCMLARQNQ
ncbi:hypothetical protein BAUCODRAFT_36773 [Baudoinia panamericana UAMH 10762]|uniref:Uncharacterized protein n=1 Tax=Baudoinia panamericana (strain UAMH 10762) TaxID=717646 RepID=M2MCN4_BAUPA|nr:uncharacterized protein BAUCODRAFT_36773 [Baudoinia panamericana UAMH 10762]EMC94301.1 hypothetical protein BAUCODRAFT_36773 [Baudoinia panamericana UAMH 10762]